MKKVFFTSVFALVLITIIGYGVNRSRDIKQFSDLALQNIEALAQFEEGSGGGETGPGELVDCGGWGIRIHKDCMNRNQFPCKSRHY